MVPAALAKTFFGKFLSGVSRDEDQGVMFVECSEYIPDVEFLLDGVWYLMKGSDLLNDMSESQDGSLCAVGFIPSMDNVWVLGHAFYKDYYITHHAQAMYMSVASDEAGTKKAPEVATEMPSSRITDDYDWFMFLAKFLAGGACSVGYWALIAYLFAPASFTGLNFLNQAGHKVTFKKKAVQDELSKLDTETVEKLLTVLKSQQTAEDYQSTLLQ